MTTTHPTGAQSVYTGRTTSWLMVAATCAGAVLLAFMAQDSSGNRDGLPLLLVLVVIGVLGDVLTASSVRATAGPAGLTIRWGPLGWPRHTSSLDEIARAEVVDLPWWRVSFGYWWTPRRTSCTVRSGPTVRLELVSGRIVTVTVPEPEVAVAALHAASDRLRRTSRRDDGDAAS